MKDKEIEKILPYCVAEKQSDFVLPNDVYNLIGYSGTARFVCLWIDHVYDTVIIHDGQMQTVTGDFFPIDYLLDGNWNDQFSPETGRQMRDDYNTKAMLIDSVAKTVYLLTIDDATNICQLQWLDEVRSNDPYHDEPSLAMDGAVTKFKAYQTPSERNIS